MGSIIVKGQPIAQKRPRFGKGRAYSIQKQDMHRWQQEVKPQIEKQHEGPLYVSIKFFIKRPKSHYRTGKNAHLLKDGAPEYPTSTPDLDNYVKWVMDCLNGIAYKDDAIVVSLLAGKYYAEMTKPCTMIDILEI